MINKKTKAMKSLSKLYISHTILTSLIFSNIALAQEARTQDTVLKTQEFNVYQIYVPEVQKKVKQKLTPELPKFETEKISYQYTVPEQKLSYTYQAIPIRPLALGVEGASIPYENYIKAGLGNLSTISLDAGISTIQAKNFQSIFHAKHLSQRKDGNIDRQNSNTEFSAMGYYQLQDHDIVGNINFNRTGLLYFGAAPELNLPPIPKDSLRQVYWGINAGIGLENSNNKPFTYKPHFNIGYYTDKYESSEINAQLQIPIAYQFEEHLKAGINFTTDINNFNYNGVNIYNNLMSLNPYVDFKFFNSDLHIGLKPTLGKESKFYLLPDIKATIPIIQNSFVLNTGFKGDVLQNTFSQLTTKNPFLFGNYEVNQTSQLKVFGGFDAKLNSHVSLGGSLGWNLWKNLPIFFNDYNRSDDGRYFTIDYDTRVSAINLDAYFKYQISESFGIVGKGAWTHFTQTDIFEKVYHEPQIKIGGEIFTKPVKGLSLNLKLDYWDRIFFRNNLMETEKLSSFVDLSLQGEYQVIPRLSLFLQLNNILNQEYQRWAQYPSYGINLMGGLRFKF
jgi:hypothetical protein